MNEEHNRNCLPGIDIKIYESSEVKTKKKSKAENIRHLWEIRKAPPLNK